MNQRIEHYGFGRLVIDGDAYASDVIILADGRVEDGRRRGRGHELVPDDLPEVLAAAPRRLVVGTGAGGLLPPDLLSGPVASGGTNKKAATRADIGAQAL